MDVELLQRYRSVVRKLLGGRDLTPAEEAMAQRAFGKSWAAVTEAERAEAGKEVAITAASLRDEASLSRRRLAAMSNRRVQLLSDVRTLLGIRSERA